MSGAPLSSGGARRLLPLLLLACAACAACAERDDGLVVDVAQEHASFPATFTTDLGYTVTLTRAHVTVRAVQLRPCESARRWWRGLLIGRAEAHGGPPAGELVAPSVHDLMTPAGTLSVMGRMPASAAEQCGVNVILGAAAADTRDVPDETFLGQTLRLEGHYRSPPGDGAERPLLVESAATLARVRPLARTALTLEHPVGELRLTYAGVASWFDGLDLDAMAPADVADVVVRRAADEMAASLTAP